MSKENLIERSQIIKNETQKRTNTAIRVGSLFEDIVGDVYDISGSVDDTITTLSGSISEEQIIQDEKIGNVENSINETSYARASFSNGGDIEIITMVQNEATKITNDENELYYLSTGQNITLESDELVIQTPGHYTVYSMITFNGRSNTTYKLSLRTRESGSTDYTPFCGCEPKLQIQTPARLVNLVSYDINNLNEGDTVSLWAINESNNESLQLHSSKIVVTRTF